MKKTISLIFTLFITLTMVGCGNDDNQTATATATQNYLYTSINNALDNKVVIMKIASDGGLEQVATVSTLGLGDADDVTPVGGGGIGDLIDSQSSMRVIGDYLLVPNAGENYFNTATGADRFNGSVSVFRISDGGASLTLIDQDSSSTATNVNSMGIRPQTMDYYNDGETTWVLVGNGVGDPFCGAGNNIADCTSQHGRPLGDGVNIVTALAGATDITAAGVATSTVADLLTNAVSPTDINGVLVNTDKRNVALFSFANGVLTFVELVATFNDATNGPITQVSFNSDGTQVAISTLGVPHLSPGSVDPDLQYPGRVYLFDVTNASSTLALSNGRFFKRNEISASIGFSRSSDNRYIYSTNGIVTTAGHQDITVLDTSNPLVFNLPASTNTALSAVTGANITTATESMLISFAALSGQTPSVVCWSWISPDDSMLFAASLAANTLSSLSVNGPTLTIAEIVSRRTSQGTAINPLDTKDIFITNNGKNAYVLGAFNTHSISMFSVASDGGLSLKPESPYNIPISYDIPGSVTSNHADNLQPNARHAYLGLTAYPALYVGY